MGYALTGGQGWNAGYRYIAILQFVLSRRFCSSACRLWKRRAGQRAAAGTDAGKPLSLREIARIPGAKAVMAGFFLLLRPGADHQPVGEQLSGAATAGVAAGNRRRLRQPVFHRHHRGAGAVRLPYPALHRRADDPHGAGADCRWALRRCCCPWADGAGAGRTGAHRPGLRADLSLHHPFHAGALRARSARRP